MSENATLRPAGPDRSAPSAFRPTGKEIGAVVCALLPFGVFVGSTSRSTLNGVVVNESSFNVAGLLFGLIALGLAIAAARGLNDRFLRGPKAFHLMLVGAAGALAVYQIVRGTGL